MTRSSASSHNRMMNRSEVHTRGGCLASSPKGPVCPGTSSATATATCSSNSTSYSPDESSRAGPPRMTSTSASVMPTRILAKFPAAIGDRGPKLPKHWLALNLAKGQLEKLASIQRENRPKVVEAETKLHELK